MPFNALKGTAADEQDILRIHVDELLLRMLASPLGRHIHDAALQEFEHGLLHALAGNVARNGRVVALAGNFVYLVNEHNAPLRLHLVKIGLLQKAREDAFHILAHITGFRKHRGVHDGKRDVQHLGDGAGQQRFTRTGGAHQQDVALFQFHAVIGLLNQVVLHAFVVVVHGHRQYLFGAVLPNHILIQVRFDFLRLGGFPQLGSRPGGLFLAPFQFLYILGSQFGTVRANKPVHPLQHERDFCVCPSTKDTTTTP